MLTDAGGPSWMSLPHLMSNFKVTSVQACAAHSAAVASGMLGQHQLAASFFNMTILLSKRLELTSDMPGALICHVYCTLVLDMGALQKFPKPGGYSVAQAHDMALRAETVSHPRQACLSEAMHHELKKHDAWSQDLKLSLQRYSSFCLPSCVYLCLSCVCRVVKQKIICCTHAHGREHNCFVLAPDQLFVTGCAHL